MTLEIRRASVEDAPALTALMHGSSAYRGAYAAIIDGYAITAAQIRHDQVFLATERDTVLGFYSLAGLPAEPELDLLFVADAAQGRGIGAALFEHMRATARAPGVVSIRIVSHPPALSFYARMGATVVGVKAPAGRVGWERPVLRLEVGAVVDGATDSERPDASSGLHRAPDARDDVAGAALPGECR